MKKRDEIEVYWAPGSFIPEDESWAFLYQEPRPVLRDIVKKSLPKASMLTCPALKTTLKNVFSLDAVIADRHELNPAELAEMAHKKDGIKSLANTGGKIPLFQPRETALDGYVNLSYGLRWLFFASEPLTIRLTAPYYPTYSPTEGALFATGEFDIGKWYRQVNLDWLIPTESKSFEFKEDSSLAFIEFMTDKKIIFKRYNLNKTLMNLAFETSNTSTTMGRHMTLIQRYRQAHSAKIPAIVLSEIRKNLVE